MFNKQSLININTGILIIGGGGAGLRAALAASLGREKVTLVSKGKIGKANNTVISGGVISAATGWRNPEDNPAVHAADTWQGGRQIGDQDLISRMTETIPGEITFLDQIGVPFKRTPEGNYWINLVPGHSYGRSFLTQNGKGTDYTVPLMRVVKKAGVELIEDVFITDLLPTSAGVTGALGFNHRFEPVYISAKALVLATGGGGRAFSATNNPAGMTADGYALALLAGLPLLDMEMVQFYPTRLAEPKMGEWFLMYEVFVFRAGGILRNSFGEDILAKHSLSGDLLTRDHICQALMSEILDGNSYHGALELDLSLLSEEKFNRYKHLLPPNSPPEKRRFKVQPVVHFMMGGVAFKPDASTCLPGLFAAGEVTGGMHGANRLAGNALSEAFAIGRIAGTNAQITAAIQPTAPPSLDTSKLSQGLDQLQSMIGPSSINEIKRLTIKTKEVTWHGAGPVRNATVLASALKEIEDVIQAIPNLRAESVTELRWLQELKNIAIVSEAILKSASVRKETRGAHYRTDFPIENTKWLGHTTARITTDKKLAIDFVRSN